MKNVTFLGCRSTIKRSMHAVANQLIWFPDQYGVRLLCYAMTMSADMRLLGVNLIRSFDLEYYVTSSRLTAGVLDATGRDTPQYACLWNSMHPHGIFAK